MPKLLVADDDARMVRLLTLTMPSSYEIAQAMDGEEAVTAAEKMVPDIVLLDVNMPKLNGFEVLRKIKQSERLRKVKVILVTARTDEADRTLGIRLGADVYLTKPFSPLLLLETVGKLLREA